jgi:nucleoside-diphosphate-sugar epimerase
LSSQPITPSSKIVITGAAGLVGQNLLLLLAERGFHHVVGLDRHAGNIAIARQLNPGVELICADLAEPGDWQDVFAGADAVVQLHAQITGLFEDDFRRNNETATHHVLDACQRHGVPYLLHSSSSVVNSVAEDAYTRTKKAQEALVMASGLNVCVLRPTLMFGWFDPKHFGWLSRFMERVPVFPIPGDGRYLRQPLYNRDFCRVILACLERGIAGQAYDIVGAEEIDYIDIIRTIRTVKALRTLILPIPYRLFEALLRFYALFSRRPPFTASQLTALTAGDYFTGVDIHDLFAVTPTPFKEAIQDTFCHPVYSRIVVGRA